MTNFSSLIGLKKTKKTAKSPVQSPRRELPDYTAISAAERTRRIEGLLAPDSLEELGKKTERVMSWTDDFEKHIFEAAEIVRKYWEAYQADDRHLKLTIKTGLIGRDKRDETVSDDLMIHEFQVLKTNAQIWLDTRKATGDAVHLKKREACQGFVELASMGIAEVASRKLASRRQQIQQSADRADPDLLLAHGTLLERMVGGGATREERDEFLRLDARLLRSVHGDGVPKDGTTEGMKLIHDASGKVAYAFKPAKGESTQMGTAKGAGTVREVLASRFFAEIDRQCNLNFRWPKVAVGSIEAGGPSGGVGALIEGLPGLPCDHEDLDKSVLAKIPDKTLQKMVLGNLASLQLDAKLGNAFVDTSGEVPDLRPSDGGAVAPSDAMLVEELLGDNKQIVGRGFVESVGGKAFDKALPDELRREFLKIDVDRLRAALADEMQQCRAQGLDAAQLDVTGGSEMMMRAVAFLQQQLAANDKLTIRQLMVTFHERFLLPYTKEKQPEVFAQAEADLRELHRRYPDVMPTFEKLKEVLPAYEPTALRKRYLAPKQLQALDLINQVGKDRLIQHGKKLPVTGVPLDFINKALRDAFPDVFPGGKIPTPLEGAEERGQDI